jgi:hypothetical protein
MSDSQEVVAPITENTGANSGSADAEMQAFNPAPTAPANKQTSAKQKFTENITGYKLIKRSTDNAEVYLVTTSGNKEIWAPKSQFDTAAETITFSPVKAGEVWVNSRTGATGTYQNDAYQFVTCGKRDSVDTKTAVLMNLMKAGFTPNISI